MNRSCKTPACPWPAECQTCAERGRLGIPATCEVNGTPMCAACFSGKRSKKQPDPYARALASKRRRARANREYYRQNRADLLRYHRENYARHRQAILARLKAERLADPEGHRLYRCVYCSQNRQRINQTARAWEQRNREHRRAYQRARYWSRKNQRRAV